MIPSLRLATVAGDQGVPQFLQLLREWEEAERGDRGDRDDSRGANEEGSNRGE